jgi:hypothetical protein
MAGTLQLTRRGMAVLAVVLLVAAAFVGKRRADFIEQSLAVRGEVTWKTRRSMGVTPEQERYPVIVRKPIFSLYRPGQSVRIRYDPRRHVPGALRAYGRVDSFRGLWLGPVVLAGCGVLVLLGALSPDRVGVRVRSD